MKALLAIAAAIALTSCYDSARVAEIGTQRGYSIGGNGSGGIIDTIRERALFGIGFANKGGRIYLPLWIGWDSSPKEITEGEPPYIYPLREK